MQPYAFQCGVCQGTYGISTKSHFAASQLICGNCVQSIVVVKFKAALAEEVNYPPALGAAFLSPDQFPGVFDDSFVCRYKRRETEYNTPITERSYCMHTLLASTAPPQQDPTCSELALTPFQIEAALRNGLELIRCGSFFRTQPLQLGTAGRECYHCRGISCAICGEALGDGRAHRCRQQMLAIEPADNTPLGARRFFRLCPVSRCRRALQYDGSFLSTCRFCKNNLCFECGEQVHPGDGHYNRGTCTRWPKDVKKHGKKTAEIQTEYDNAVDREMSLRSLPGLTRRFREMAFEDEARKFFPAKDGSNVPGWARNAVQNQSSSGFLSSNDRNADETVPADRMPKLEELLMTDGILGNGTPPRLSAPDSRASETRGKSWAKLSVRTKTSAELFLTIMQAELAEVWTDLEPHRFGREVRVISILSLDVSMAIQIMFHATELPRDQRRNAVERFVGLRTQIAGAVALDGAIRGIMKHLPSLREALEFIKEHGDRFIADIRGSDGTAR